MKPGRKAAYTVPPKPVFHNPLEFEFEFWDLWDRMIAELKAAGLAASAAWQEQVYRDARSDRENDIIF